MPGFGKKDPFEDLDSEFKDAVASSTAEDINKRIAQVVQNDEELRRARVLDEHLAECKALVKNLSGPYDKKTKEHGILTDAISRVLQDKAIATPTADDLKRRLAETAKAEEQNQKSKAEDQELESAKEDAKEVNGTYSDGFKMNRLRIQYCMRVLKDKGQA